MKTLRKIYKYLSWMEEERIKAMIYCGKAW